MPDELPVTDGAPEAAPAQPDVDWQKRYTDTHAEFNRLNEQFSRFQKDPNSVIEFLQQHHPDLIADDEPEVEEPDYTDEDEAPMTRAEFKQWQADQKATADAQAREQATAQQFETDLKTFAADRELSKKGEAAIRYALAQGEIKGPDDLKQHVDEWFEYEDSLRGPKQKPRVPHVPSGGQANTGIPDWSGMTRSEQDKYMAERVQSLASD